MVLILGIDIGTTSLKVCCIEVDNGNYEVKQRSSLAYQNHLKSNEFKLLNKDNLELDDLIKTGDVNVILILSTFIYCLNQLDIELRNNIKAIGLCGQMHGVLYWNRKCLNRIRSIDENKLLLNFNLDFNKDYQDFLSNLITWEDNRCNKEFLDSLPDNLDYENRKAYTGFGIATTFWYLKNNPTYLDNYDFIGSIMDFIVHLLCLDLDHPVTSFQLANSYGYFDLATNTWSKSLDDSKFPKHKLPKILNDNQLAGRLNYSFLGLKSNLPIFVACGDLQSAIYSVQYLQTINKDKTAILNSGTSMQLAFTIDQKNLNKINSTELLNLINSKLNLPSNNLKINNSIHLDIVPYFNKQYLFTANSLNGGNVLSFFINSIKKFISDLFNETIELSELELWSKITILTKKYIEENLDKEEEENELNSSLIPNILPRLNGERYEDIKSNLSINSITKDNFHLSKLYYSLCISILNNIFSMCPLDLLKQIEINRIQAIGSTIMNNEILRICLEQKLSRENFELIYESNSEADIGISLVSFENLLNLDSS